MKITRSLTIATVLLGLTGIAQAITFRVLDPHGPLPSAPNITEDGLSIPFSFYDDYNATTGTDGCPGGADGCFDAVNNTGAPITSLTFTISTNVALTPAPDSDSLDCPVTSYAGLPSFSTNVTCDASVSSGYDTFTVTFTGGSVAPYSSLWIVEEGIPAADFNGPPSNGSYPGTFEVNATPEPSSLWLTLTGLGPLGYALRRRRGAGNA